MNSRWLTEYTESEFCASLLDFNEARNDEEGGNNIFEEKVEAVPARLLSMV